MSMLPVPTTGGELRTLTRIPGTLINVRNDPDGKDVGDLIPGDVVMYFPPTDKSEGWAYIVPAPPMMQRNAQQQPAASGWVSLQAGKVEFTPLAPPTPTPAPAPMPAPEPMVTLTISVADYNAIYSASKLWLDALERNKPPAASGGGF